MICGVEVVTGEGELCYEYGTMGGGREMVRESGGAGDGKWSQLCFIKH